MTREELLLAVARKECEWFSGISEKEECFINGCRYAESHSRWVSVNDRLPGKGEVVIVSNGEQRCCKLDYLNDGNEWTYRCAFTIRFWCPIPKIQVP